MGEAHDMGDTAIDTNTHRHFMSGEKYHYPEDEAVLAKLKSWQDRKFGLMMHFGLYSELGIVESWPLCSEDQDFQDRGGMPYDAFKKMYFGLIEKLDPRNFDPEPWAVAAKKAGMNYVVFTTKHHDGFCLFDTKETEFRITGPRSPFRNHPKADMTKEVFEVFLKKNFMIGAYFSKPDWHHSDYWSPLWATPDRNNNYDIRKHPEMWKRFKDFTFRQIEELMTGYGPIDILWLDGGWVRPLSTVTDEVRSWGARIPEWDQDIDMPKIAAMARKHQPGLLVVDRTVHGPFENYRTPEQNVPDRILPFPWETCITLTQSWGHSSEPEYKSSEQLIHTLVDVVSKGGNLLLNIGPTPEGTFEDAAYDRLNDLAAWMAVNGEAIHGTRPWVRFGEGDAIRFTRSKDEKYLYAICFERPRNVLMIRDLKASECVGIHRLEDDEPMNWESCREGVKVRLPAHSDEVNGFANNCPSVFRITLDENT